jgi:hypothetical protein
VYISAKTDKQGKRFGFARFVDVVDTQALLEKIEGTWFGSFKIRANISKFKRGELVVQNPVKPTGVESVLRQSPKEGVMVDNSFKQILVEGRKKQDCAIDGGGMCFNHTKPSTTEQPHVIDLEAIPGNIQKLKDCFVGFLREEVDPNNLQMLLAMEGLQFIQAAPLGVDVVLLSCAQPDGVKNSLQTNSDWWNRVFVEVSVWNPNLVPAGKRIWVRVFGVPPQAWSLDSFRTILERFGVLIKLDSQTQKQTRLDVARVLIFQHTWDRIDAILEVRLEAAMIAIRVVEERPGDIDLTINDIGRSPSSEEVSSKSSVKGWRGDGAAVELGWRGDDESDEGTVDDF